MSLWNQNDAFMCKVYVSSLGEHDLRWYDKLPPQPIYGWAQLSEAFLARFVSNSRISKGLDTLFNTRKDKKESLREYARRYWKAYGDLEEDVCSEPLAALYFKQALLPSHKLRQSLTKRPASDLKELRARIEERARVKDDTASIQVSVADKGVKASWQHRAGQPRREDQRMRYGQNKQPTMQTEEERSRSYKAITTVFTEPIYRLLEKIKGEPYFVWPPKMMGDPARRNQEWRCTYHREKGH
ncbi:uncharacterized protein LOC114318778 [Camellia sinensis]|uniref:uncharacterized protein LOC114318778 n=1 Tax=Camellia sinensis TaxID=4442 RepID=UPI0010367466|nr:uncharacterized protein LOC114318778 [Camellia sinensis]